MTTSFYMCDNSDLIKFHTKMEGEENVEKFHKKWKNIVSNREVYIAYLQKYYKGNENEFMELIK